MKKLILLSALLIAGISVNAQNAAQRASAQQTQAAASKATTQMEKIDKIVTLTAAQKEKVYSISFEMNKAIDAAARNKETFEAEKSKIKEKAEKDLFAVLTSDQQTKFKTAKAQEQKKKAGTK
jgi:periplasmic protein CpxP/Spy